MVSGVPKDPCDCRFGTTLRANHRHSPAVAHVLYLSLILAPGSLEEAPSSASGTWREVVRCGRGIYEHSTRSFRPNPRWLMRAFVHLLHTGSRPLSTAPVSNRRCRKWRFVSTGAQR